MLGLVCVDSVVELRQCSFFVSWLLERVRDSYDEDTIQSSVVDSGGIMMLS